MSCETPQKDQINSSNVSMNILGEPDKLDFILSAKTPKSKLRQLAQKSVTKNKIKFSNPNHQDESQSSVEYLLDLGAPSQPIFDPALASTTTKRSIRRRSSGPASKFLTPTHKPRKSVVDESFEILFKNMSVSATPSTQTDSRHLGESSGCSLNSKPNKEFPMAENLRRSRRITIADTFQSSGSSSDLKAEKKLLMTQNLRRSRRITIVNISEDNSQPPEPEVISQLELNQSNVSNEVCETHECDGQNDNHGCGLDQSVVDRLDLVEGVSSKGRDTLEDGEEEEDAQEEKDSDDDDEDGDDQALAEDDVPDGVEDEEKDDVQDEDEDEDEEDQICFKGRRVSLNRNKKSMIVESDSEEIDHPISTRKPRLQALESDDEEEAENHSKSNPQTSHELSMSHNRRQADQPARLLKSRYEASDSDDSIELDPKRKALFELNRARVLGLTSVNPLETHYESPPKNKTTKKQPPIIDLTDSPPSPTCSKSTVPRQGTKMTGSVPPKPPTQSKTPSSTPLSRRSTSLTTTKKPIAKKEIPFAKVRDDLAESLIERLNQEVFGNKLPNELDLIWSNRLNTTAGKAKWSVFRDNQTGVILREKVVIELGTKVVDSESRLMNTLAHELCHVATWIIDRQKDEKHGKYFKAWARKIHKVIPQIEVTTKHTYEIDYKFKWNCSSTDCSRTYGRHSNSIKPDKQMCECGGNLIPVPRIRKRAIKKVIEDEDLNEMMENLIVKV